MASPLMVSLFVASRAPLNKALGVTMMIGIIGLAVYDMVRRPWHLDRHARHRFGHLI